MITYYVKPILYGPGANIYAAHLRVRDAEEHLAMNPQLWQHVGWITAGGQLKHCGMPFDHYNAIVDAGPSAVGATFTFERDS